MLTAIREGHGDRAHRRELVAGLSGRVIEVGTGIGANFDRYPTAVDELVAIEPEPWLRKRAQQAAADAEIAITVIDGDADHLPGNDGSFDAAVVSLVLCTVPEPRRAIAELFRVIRPGGQLRFFEHVVADVPVLVRLQKLADATLWPHIAGGCHLARDSRANIEAAGFIVEDCERFPVRLARLLPAEPHLLGRARRP